MKQLAGYWRPTTLKWLLVWLAIYALWSWPTFDVAAQDPTPIPTPTSANTPTAASPSPTPSPTADGSSPTATATEATSTTRLLAFRVSDDEINSGECVQFSWVVKGDVGYVEFAANAYHPILVSEEGSHQVCPDGTNVYQLLVTWLDQTQAFSEILQVEVEEAEEAGDGSGSGSGGSGQNATPAAGIFVAVTPVPILTPPLATQPTPIPGSSGAVVVPTPAGILGSVAVLPETGHASVSSPLEKQAMAQPIRPHSVSPVRFIPVGFLTILLVGLVGGLFLRSYF